MLSSSARLLKALSLLQARRFWSGQELADALETTTRNVRRDVDRLRALGYPVHATSGVGGGYSLGAGRDLPPLPLDDDEALAVAFGLRAVATGWVGGLEDAAIGAIAKLEQVLPKRLRRRLGDIQAVSVQAPDAGPRAIGAVLANLTHATRELRLIRFEYRDRGGAHTTRTVEPYRLVHAGARWYLLAWDRDREDWRNFRVDRLGPELSTLHGFRPRPLPADDVAAFVTRAMSSETWRYRARLTVFEPAASVAARVPERYGRVRPLDEARCELITGGDDLGWLAAWLGMLGFEMQVHEPPELLALLGALSERYARACIDSAT